MNEELKEKIYKILTELPSENACLDYKTNSYKDNANDQAEFIKDLNGFLNSMDGYGHDKFIIIGVYYDDKKRKYILNGLQEHDMNDDNYYQNLASHISPRPSLETGKLKYPEGSENEFGYIYIPADKNQDRVYIINKDYPDIQKSIDVFKTKIQNIPALIEEYEKITDELKRTMNTNKVYKYTAWIRYGSVNTPLECNDIKKIYEINQEDRVGNPVFIPKYDLATINSKKNTLKMAVLLGGWDESYEGDKEVISNLLGGSYDEVINEFRTMLKDENSPITFKNGKWKIEDRINLLKSLAENYFKDDIQNFQKTAIEISTQINPKFELAPEQRSFANIYGIKSKYSELLKKSVAETLPMVSSITKDFINCSDDIVSLPYYVVNDVLKTDNWELLATLEMAMPSLAEAAPETFLKCGKIKLETIQIQ